MEFQKGIKGKRDYKVTTFKRSNKIACSKFGFGFGGDSALFFAHTRIYQSFNSLLQIENERNELKKNEIQKEKKRNMTA